jgi:quercetin dioxygenase-like cupin family protein
MRGHALLVVAALVSGAAGGGALAAPAATTPVVWPTADIKWTDNPGIAGAKVAVLWGDPKAGAYAALKSVPGGAVLPMHSHTNDHKVVLVGGALAFTLEGSAAKDLTSGSYVFIPGGVKHKAECKGTATCTYFEESPGAFDMKAAEEKK